MNKKYLTVMVIGCTIVSSCFADIKHPQSLTNNCVDMELEQTKRKIHEKMYEPFSDTLPLNVSEDYLKERFGSYNVLSEEIELAIIREPSEKPYKIKSESWDFNGIILNVKSTYPKLTNTYWIKKISITKNNYQLELPIKIGNTFDEIQCHLGKVPSNRRKDKKLIFSTTGRYTDLVDVAIYFDANHLVEKIEFEYFKD